MTEQLLNDDDVHAGFECVCGEGVAEPVRYQFFFQPGALSDCERSLLDLTAAWQDTLCTRMLLQVFHDQDFGARREIHSSGFVPLSCDHDRARLQVNGVRGEVFQLAEAAAGRDQKLECKLFAQGNAGAACTLDGFRCKGLPRSHAVNFGRADLVAGIAQQQFFADKPSKELPQYHERG